MNQEHCKGKAKVAAEKASAEPHETEAADPKGEAVPLPSATHPNGP